MSYVFFLEVNCVVSHFVELTFTQVLRSAGGFCFGVKNDFLKHLKTDVIVTITSGSPK